MTAGRRTTKLKTYDQSALMAEEMDEVEPDQPTLSMETMEEDDD